MNSKMLVIAGAMTLAAFAAAQEAPFGPAKGVKTISASGSYSSTKQSGQSDTKNTQLTLAGSYFFTNSIEGRLGYTYANVDAGDGSVSDDRLLLGGRYYFNSERALTMESPLAPFAGVYFTTEKLTGVDRMNGFGAEVGVQYFVQPNVSITPTVSWDRSRVNGNDVDTWQVGFGLTVWFK